MVRMRRKFLRRDWNKKSRLGGRRKKLVWRRAKGRHSKVRQQLKGYSQMPQPGYGSPKKTFGFIQGKKPVMISTLNDVEKVKANEIGIVSSTLGRKSRIEIAKRAISLKTYLFNLNPQKFLEEIKKKQDAGTLKEPAGGSSKDEKGNVERTVGSSKEVKK